MKKKWIALSAALCLVISLLGACGNTENGSGNTGDKQTQAPASNGDVKDTDAADTEGKTTAADDADDEDMSEINMVYISMGPIPNGLSDVQDAINAITEEEINTHVNLEMIESGNYEQQIGLKTSSNEKVDLLVTLPMGSASYNNMASQNQLMDITDYLEEYGQDILSTVGDLVKATTRDGRIYGVTTYRSLVTSAYIVMRTDVLEDLGLLEKAQNMTSLSEYTEILKAVKESEKWGSLAGIVPSDAVGTCLALSGCYLGQDKFADATAYDQLGDLNKIIAINPDGSDPVVKNNYAADEYKAMWEQMQKWYNDGYVYKDVTTNKEMAGQLVKSNVAFSFFCQSEIGVETSKTQECGMPVTCVKMLTLPTSTSSCTKFVWTVPSSATEPEAAVKFMNMMYTDSRIANLLAWGIEGTHYQVKDGIGYYMDGEDANNCAYHTIDFLFGNQFIVLPWEGQSADFREVAKKEMDEGGNSAYLGFSCDTTVISTELSAISNVLAEFRPAVDGGVASADDYQQFLDKLEASGIQKVIDAYQSQLDEWLAANK